MTDTAPSVFSVTSVTDWAIVPEIVDEMNGAIVLATDAHALSIVQDAIILTNRFPFKTIRIAGHHDGPAMMYSSQLIPLQSSLDSRGARHIWDEYYYACVRTELQRLASDLEQADLSPVLTSALVTALRSQRPFSSVAALSEFTGINRKTLWRHWDADGHPRWPVRLLDVLDWITLVHLTARKTPSRSWASLAKWVGLDVRTLNRQAKALTGHSLSVLANIERESTRYLFTIKLKQLIDPARSDAILA
jgi:hypothetical protein